MSQLKRRRRGFARFWREHETALLRSLRRRAQRPALRDEALAEDLVQEGLVAVWEVAEQLNGHRHPLRVARYVATRRMRRYLVMRALREGREAERQQRVLDALLARRRAKAVA